MTRSPPHTESPKRANSWSTSLHLFNASLLVVVAFAPSQLCSTLPASTYQPCPLADQLSTNLTQFKDDEICDTINLAGTIDLSSNYSHCRVINGFVSIRHWKLGPSANNVSALNVQFPNLEIITQFLLLYKINTVKDTVSLNTIFPKLHLIAGEQRFLNHTVYISKFFADDKIELNNLAEVCGPMWIQHSPLVCFRHSNLYWRLIPQINKKEYFDHTFDDLNITKNLLNPVVGKDHIDARLNIDYEMPADKWSELSRFKYARFSIFDIDPIMYRFITGEEPHPPNCTQLDRIEIAFEFADLVNSDHVNTFLVDHMKRHLDTMIPLGKLNLSAHCITEPPIKLKELKPQFDIANSHYDIRHIYHSLIPNPQYNVAEMDEQYSFKFDHLYIIKVLLCFGPTLHECSISKFRKLLLKKSMFGENGIIKPDRFKKGIPTNTFPEKANFSSEKSTSFFKMHITTLAIAFGFLLFFLLTIVVVPRVKQCISMPSWFSKAEVVSSNPDYTAISSIWSCDQMSEGDLTEDTSYEIDRLNLKILYHKLLGKGEFGNVYEGLLFPNAANIPDNYGGGDTGAIRVAIKMLRENTKEMDRERFVTEAGLMRAFNSNFLVKLIGVCTLQEPILVVMEYMEHGDLKRYLRQKFQSYQDQPSFALMPTFETSVRMAIQIADGMFYLHSKRIIHRDLAARNCMVAADFTVKIGDFGMTRGIYLSDYYRMSDQALMPLRWMAPESVRKMVFTQQTDVWSYGVVLWEIMSFGEQPYRGKTDQEVKEMLVDCVRLCRPTYHTPAIWEVAKSCWHKNPNNRPTFFTIIEKLYGVLGKLQTEFRLKSHFHSCGTMHRRSLGFAVWNFISEHCLDMVGKLSHQHDLEHDSQQTDYTRQPFLQQHQQSPCQPIPTLCFPGAGVLCRTVRPPSSASSTCMSANASSAICPAAANFNRHGACRSSRSSVRSCSTTSTGHHLFRPRCSSFDSSRSTNVSETTTLTLISSNSQCEPSMESRHNSAGSNNSATSTLSEQAPLI